MEECGDEMFGDAAPLTKEYLAAMEKELQSTNVLHTSVDTARKVFDMIFKNTNEFDLFLKIVVFKLVN